MSGKEGTKVYWNIYWALMALLVVTVGVAFVDLGQVNMLVAMTVSLVKAVLVILWFMHVKESEKMVWVLAAASFYWILIFFVILFADYMVRIGGPGWPV